MSDDGRTVAFIAVAEGAASYSGGDVYLWRDGEGSILIDDQLKPRNVHMSADGTKIAFVSSKGDRQLVVFDVATGGSRILERAWVNDSVLSFTADGSRIMYGVVNETARLMDLTTGVVIEFPQYRNDDASISGNGDYVFFNESDSDGQLRGYRHNLTTGRVLPLGTENTVCGEAADGTTCYPPLLPQTSLDGQRIVRIADRDKNGEGTSIMWRDIASGITHKRIYSADLTTGDLPPVMNRNGTVVFSGTKETTGNELAYRPTRWDPISGATLAVAGNGWIAEANSAGDIALAETPNGYEIWEMSGPLAPMPPGFDWMAAIDIRELTISSDFTPAHADVLRLYWAFFNRAPDLDGAKYWLAVNSAGVNFDEIADHFAVSSEFEQNYEATTNRQFLEAIYNNVLGRKYDLPGLEYWLAPLDRGDLSRGGVVRWIAANSEFVNNHSYPE